MAFSIEYVYKAIDSFTGTAKQINRSVGKLTGSIGNLGKRFGFLTTKFNRTENHLISGFKRIAGAAAAYFGGREVINAATTFEDAMADLSAITGAAGKDLAFFEKQALALAESSVTAQAEVAGALKIVASAKSELLKDPKGLVEVTKQILLLKNASGIDLAEAADVATAALNQFGAGADQALRFVNVLAAGSKVGASEVRDTGQAIIRAGSQALSSKVSFEELNAAIQVLAKGGEKGERAGTALRSMMNKLEVQGKKLGVDKIRPSVVGLAQAFENLTPIMNDPVAMAQILGEEYNSMGLILTRNAALVKQWTKEITGTNIAQEQADKRLATLNSKWRQLGIIIKTKLIAAFELIKPAVEKATAFLGNIRNEVTAFSKEHPKLFKFGLIVAGVAAAFSVLSLAISAVAIVFGTIFTPIALVIGGISGLIYLVSEFSGRWSELPGAAMDALGEIWDFFFEKNPITLFMDSLEILINKIKSIDLSSILPESIATMLGIKTSIPEIVAPNVVTAATEMAIQRETVIGGITAEPSTGRMALDLNVHVRDRSGAVEAVQAKPSSGIGKLNVGRNM